MIVFLSFFSTYVGCKLVLGLGTQPHKIVPGYDFFMNICNLNLIYGFLSCQDVKFSFQLYGCNLKLFGNKISCNVNNIWALKVFHKKSSLRIIKKVDTLWPFRVNLISWVGFFLQVVGNKTSYVYADGAFQSHFLLHFVPTGIYAELLWHNLDPYRRGTISCLDYASRPSTPIPSSTLLQKRAFTGAWRCRIRRGNCASPNIGSEGELGQ